MESTDMERGGIALAARLRRATMRKRLTMDIFSIKTEYNGITFRSRLESRYAAFLDSLSVQWDYEPETIRVGGINYVPDFWLPDYGTYLEVKPVIDAERIEKPIALATKSPTVVMVGDIFHHMHAWYGRPGLPSSVFKVHLGLCGKCDAFLVATIIGGEHFPILAPTKTKCAHTFVRNPQSCKWDSAFLSKNTTPETTSLKDALSILASKWR